MFRKFFLTSFLVALQYSWGASCYIDCSEISATPSTIPIPSGVSCSYTNVNYTATQQAWSFPPSSNYTSEGVCEVSISQDEELKTSIDSLIVALSALWSAIAFSGGLMAGLMAGRILINVV